MIEQIIPCSRSESITLRASIKNPIADTPQFRGGNPYFFSENLYQSVSFTYASMCIAKTLTRFISRCILQKKSRHCVGLPNKNRQPAAKNQKRSFTSRGATVGLGLRLCLARLLGLQGRENLQFFGNLAEKIVVSTIKLFCFALHNS